LRNSRGERCARDPSHHGRLRLRLDKPGSEHGAGKTATKAKPPRFATGRPEHAEIVGADAANDQTILSTAPISMAPTSSRRGVMIRRSARSPNASRALPLRALPLVAEHRLYQADWLMRFYGFDVGEIVATAEGMLPLDIDPKLAWALLPHADRLRSTSPRHAARDLCALPGFGTKAVDRIIATRRTNLHPRSRPGAAAYSRE